MIKYDTFLDQYEMADIECRRGLMQFLNTSPAMPYLGEGREELLHTFSLHAKLDAMKIHRNSVLTLFSEDYDKRNALRACSKGMSILAHAECILALDPIEPLYKHFRSTMLLITSWKNISEGNYEEALNDIVMLMEVIEVQGESLFLPNSLLIDDGKMSRYSSEYLEANLIYAKLLETINPQKSNFLMLDVLRTACKYDMIVLNFEALLLYSLAQQNLHLCDFGPCKNLIYYVYNVARTLVFPQLKHSAKVAMNTLKRIEKKMIIF